MILYLNLLKQVHFANYEVQIITIVYNLTSFCPVGAFNFSGQQLTQKLIPI